MAFSVSKLSNMGSAVLLVALSSDVQEFCFQAAKLSYTECAELRGVYLLIVRNGIFKLRNVQVSAGPSCKRVDLLMLRNSVFTVRNV